MGFYTWQAPRGRYAQAGGAYRPFRRPNSLAMAAAETAARKAKRGLWADAKPIPPWDWRQSERERRQKSRSDVDTSYWLNTSSGVRDVCGGAASN
jgi:hypothetical protein